MKRIGLSLVFIISGLLLTVACNGSDTESETNGQAAANNGTETEEDADTEADSDTEEDTGTDKELTLSSTAFGEGEDIPTRYSCDGEDISPQLTWNNAPAGTQSFVLIMDDPDAPGGVFTHWVLFNIPANTRQLPEAFPVEAELDNGARHGINGFGNTYYGGPCPPSGSAHRYQFTLYALDITLNLPAGVSRPQVLNATQGHILGTVTLTGLYQY